MIRTIKVYSLRNSGITSIQECSIPAWTQFCDGDLVPDKSSVANMCNALVLAVQNWNSQNIQCQTCLRDGIKLHNQNPLLN